MPTLATTLGGLALPNPFVIASGPPGANGAVLRRALDEGWGAVVCKTVCLDASRIVNVHPRYARLRSRSSGEVYGWENIELISDRPLEAWLDEFRRLKDARPEGVLIASVMEEYNRDAWHEVVGRCEEAGVDGLELNMSCPHGLPERRMGSAMGEDPEVLAEVCGWVRGVATRPVWAKLTPNVTRIEPPARAALAAGCDGVTAINTIRAILGVDLETLRPEPSVEGYSTVGGYSSLAVRPIALRIVAEIAALVADEFPDRSLMGLGGVETGEDAAEFLLLGASAVQVCTGVMKHGYGCVGPMKEALLAFMERRRYERIDDFRGKSLEYLVPHAELVRRQTEARVARAADARRAASGSPPQSPVASDAAWDADDFVEQSDALSRG